MNMPNSDANPSNISPDDWERIARYITGEANAAEIEATRLWIETAPDRRAVVRLLETVVANVARDEPADLEVEHALTSVKARFDEPKILPFAARLTSPQESRSIAALLRVAAAVLIVVGATLVWQRVETWRGGEGARTYATSVGERREVSLRDGTRVLLGPTSRLVVLAAEADDRGVMLAGIAYFNVVHDSAHPFTVKAGAITIQDVGTAFSVENDDSAGTRVAVDSGSVAIGGGDQPGSRGPILHARDRAVADAAGTVSIERSAVSDVDLAWV